MLVTGILNNEINSTTQSVCDYIDNNNKWRPSDWLLYDNK